MSALGFAHQKLQSLGFPEILQGSLLLLGRHLLTFLGSPPTSKKSVERLTVAFTKAKRSQKKVTKWKSHHSEFRELLLMKLPLLLLNVAAPSSEGLGSQQSDAM